MRVDAARNRERLVAVARAAFTSGAGKVSLEAVAKQAGVGIGTLYRHFPTRESLIEAVYLAEREKLGASAPELLARLGPVAGLRAWMDGFADYLATKREMADALRAVIASGAITASQARLQLSAAARVLLDAGAAQGTLRADVEPEDVVVALLGIGLTCGQPEQRAQAGRLMDLLLQGLTR